MFSNRDLRRLLIPLVIEQTLTSFIGTIDTMMVSNLGSASISGVSLVDSINKLVIFLFTALATGGAIVCSQYLGRGDRKSSGSAARQVLLSSFVLSAAVMALCLAFRGELLRLIFGSVEADVMEAAMDYFLVTAFSYPFIAVFGAGAALYRAAGNSRLPMLISIGANLVNIVGNALLMYVFDMGVSGAALATLLSYILGAGIVLICLRRPGQEIDVGRLSAMRPDFSMIWLVLCIGLPTGIENAMFQFGKLAVQSTVSTLGTAAIAANAVVAALELVSSMPSQGIGTGLMTVVGQCMGAGQTAQAKYYIKKLTLWSAVVLLAMSWLLFALTFPVVKLSGMEPDAAEMTVRVMLIISIVKPFLWPLAFVPANGMRAAGDVKFGMIASSVSMWIFRVALSVILTRFLNMGLVGIWCGYFADWTVRSIVFTLRYRGESWSRHHVIDRQ